MAYFSGHGPRHLVKPEPTLEDFKRAARNLHILLVAAGQRVEPLINNLNRTSARLERAADICRPSS